MSDALASELLGFGKHSSLTYEQARTREPSYLEWARSLVQPSAKVTAWLAYCEAVEGANPQTPPKTKRTRDDFICPVHKTPMDGPRIVKNGLPQNLGRQFYKCPLGAECGLKGFRWADGSAPFSEQSVRRAESHHGVPVGSIGVGIVGGAADYLTADATAVFDDPDGKRARTAKSATDDSPSSDPIGELKLD